MPLIDKPAAKSPATGDRAGGESGCRVSVRGVDQTGTQWRGTSPRERISLVDRLAERLAERGAEFAEAIASETGKPLRFSRVEVHRAAVMLRRLVARYRDTAVDEHAGSARILRKPLGTIAVITPANNPVYIPLGKIGPALLYGNNVIWKPAPESQGVSARLLEELADVPAREELVRLLAGGRGAAEALMNDPRIDAVTITGSEPAGQVAREICARRNMPLQAELGGNNAAIVWSDANLSAAAEQIAKGAFEMAGQRCTANRRVIVHQDCRAAFLELLVRESARLIWGDPLSLDTQIGPLVSRSRCAAVAAMVDRAIPACGSAIHTHGTTLPESCGFAGCWYPPTILCCDDTAAEIVQEETFGPVLVVQTAKNWDHAIELCNGVRQGLAAALFTRSRQRVDRFVEQAQAGILKINRTTADVEVDVPFCAWKASGTGPPKHGVFSRDFYTRPQTVYGLETEITQE